MTELSQMIDSTISNLMKSFNKDNLALKQLFDYVKQGNVDKIERILSQLPNLATQIAVMAILDGNNEICIFALARINKPEEIKFVLESIIIQKPFCIKPYIVYMLNNIVHYARMVVISSRYNGTIESNIEFMSYLMPFLSTRYFNEFIEMAKEFQCIDMLNYIEKVKSEREHKMSISSRLHIQHDRTQCLVREIESLIVLYDV